MLTSAKSPDDLNDPSNAEITVYDMMGMLVAHGSADEIHLEDGLYIVKSKNKTTKLLIKN